MSYKTHTVSSLSSYIETVNKIQQDWSKRYKNVNLFPWFRGHSNSEGLLLPGLYRNNEDSYDEFAYRSDFILKAIPFLSDSAFTHPRSDWEWYFLMQHYGLPTRLLDWTEGSLIALHFALFYKRDDDETEPCVWMLDPFALNIQFYKRDQIFFYHDDGLKDFVPNNWTDHHLPKWPAAIQPIYNSKRIVVQKGCFTIHGRENIALEKIPGTESYLAKIKIDYFNMPLIGDELIVAGITESSLFPELAGLARELKEFWKKRPDPE